MRPLFTGPIPLHNGTGGVGGTWGLWQWKQRQQQRVRKHPQAPGGRVVVVLGVARPQVVHVLRLIVDAGGDGLTANLQRPRGWGSTPCGSGGWGWS